jgi:hypothetical protein
MPRIKWLFWAAGIYGILIVAPLFFLEDRLGADYPPAITHPEYYYGFAGSVLGYQLMYLMIGVDPVRFRPLMLVGAACKLAFALAVWILYAQERVAGTMVGASSIDAVLAVAFIIAWAYTPRPWNGNEFR